jgi:hypothetical protein
MQRLLSAAFVLISVLALSACQKSTSAYNGVFTSTSTYSLAATRSIDLNLQRPISKRKTTQKKTHFIEFRARNALSYGHASVILGRLDKNGKVPVDAKGVLLVGETEVAGLHPRTANPRIFTLGHVVPVAAETGWSDGDSEDAYVTARYRVDLTKPEFDKVVAIVNNHKKNYKTWHAVTQSCVTFLRAIAKSMGLKTPKTPHLPKRFVESLQRLNG